MIILKNKLELTNLEDSGKILGEVLHELYRIIKPGMTGNMLNKVAEEKINKLGGKPVFKDYRGFPSSICVSINDVLVHGIPSDIEFTDNDIIKVDAGVIKNNYCSDAAFSICFKKELTNLLTTTKECLYNAINICRSECRIGDISSTIQKTAKNKNFNVVMDYGGHGVGRNVHELPFVPNYGTENTGFKLKYGSVIAIEPILSEGSHQTYVKEDGWSAATVDGSFTAHFEHTVLITKNEAKILTNYE